MSARFNGPWLTGALFLMTGAALDASPAALNPAPAAVSVGPEQAIRARFAASYPEVKISSIGPTVWKNVYELVTPDGIIYSDAAGDFAMSGQMMATRNKQNLTQARLSTLTRIDFGSLPFNSAIKVVKGNGSRKLAVFADPNCPYCRQLEEELQGISDLTVYTFLFPLEDIHPGARQNATSIWCAKDQPGTWTAWMLKRSEPKTAACPDDPITALNKLGIELNIVGTPTLFFADGRRISGLIKQAQLEQELSKVGPT